MRTYSRVIGTAGILCTALWMIFSPNAFAQEDASTSSDATDKRRGDEKRAKDLKQKIFSDVQEIKQNREANRSHAEAAIQKEKDLRDQIHEAVQSGDQKKAESLREQLKATHRENVREKHQDMQNVRESRQELRSDIKDAHRDGALPPRRFNPPGYNPPGVGPGNPPGYNPPGVGPGNPPGYNPPGVGPHNPPGYNPPGAGPYRPPHRRPEDFRDHRNDGDGQGFRDPSGDRRGGPRGDQGHHRGGDDGRRYFGDARQDGGGRQGDAGQNQGVRDHGAGKGAGKGQGGMHRQGENSHRNNDGPRRGPQK